MLETITAQPPDALLALIKLYDQDPRADKIDLGVGVYRTGQGDTPVFGAIKAAERKLVEEQDSKAYLGPEGDMGFVHALMPYVFGASDPTLGGRIEGMQTPGGTGAVRLAAALAKRAGVGRVWMGTPSWPNHAQILKDLGLEVGSFQHAAADGTADIEAVRAALRDAAPGDAILLHGCCHNPTGIDYSPAQWDEIAGLIAKSGVLPLLDLAYQGLGQGMEEDAYGVRRVLDEVPEAIVAYSCDKNFGLYRDRVGAVYVVAQQAQQLPAILSNGYALARAAWSMPPDHGAAAVRLVLADPQQTVDPDTVIDGDLATPQRASPPATAPATAPDASATPGFGEAAPVSDGPITDELPTTASGGPIAPASPAPANQSTSTYSEQELLPAAQGVFGKGARGVAEMIESVLKKQGRPDGYIIGTEVGGAFVVGARYGSGTLYHKIEGQREVHWTGPSVGFDVGGSGGRTFILVYNLNDTQDLFHRYIAGEGQAYFFGGFNISELKRDDVVLIPVRMGIGMRLGVNVGYMRFTEKKNILPF